MKLLDELKEASISRAMSVEDIVKWWGARARCVRCRHYDTSFMECGKEQDDTDCRDVWNPASFGCIHFDG